MYLKNKENICKIYININKDINKYNKENICDMFFLFLLYYFFIISKFHSYKIVK